MHLGWISENVYFDQTTSTPTLLEVMHTNNEKDHSGLLPEKARACHGEGLCLCSSGNGNLHLCDDIINAEKYMELL